MNATVIPTQEPSSAPTSQPTLVPSSSPSISFAPSLSTEAMIYFSVEQEVTGLDVIAFSADWTNEIRFMDALAASVPLLQLRNIQFNQVLSVPPASDNDILMNPTVAEAAPLSTVAVSTSLSVTRAEGATLITYNVSYLVYSNGFSNPVNAYDAVVAEIRAASEHGMNSTLTLQLQKQGGVFTTTSVTDVPPTVSSVVTHSLNSISPTSLPSLSPSCGTGSYISETEGDSSCLTCPPGTYSAIGGAESCMDCAVGYFTDSDGNSMCEKCPWPFTTLKTGWSECHALALDLNDLHTGVFCIAVLVMFIVSLMASKDNKITSAVIFTIPMLDISTDMLYIARSKFVNIHLFFASILCTFVFPVLCFIGLLMNVGAYPRIFGLNFLRPLLWLGHNAHGYPTVGGKAPPFFALRFVKHDSIIKIFLLGIYWVILSTVQVICSIPVVMLIMLQSPLLLLWLLLGAFLYQIKVVCIGSVWNFWFMMWTGQLEFHTTLDLKVKFYNKSLLAEFLFESLPQNFIMWFNNTRTHVWSLTGYLSATLSLFMTIDGIWRITYYKIYSKQSFEDIPVGFGIVKVDNRNSLNKGPPADRTKLIAPSMRGSELDPPRPMSKNTTTRGMNMKGDESSNQDDCDGGETGKNIMELGNLRSSFQYSEYSHSSFPSSAGNKTLGHANDV